MDPNLGWFLTLLFVAVFSGIVNNTFKLGWRFEFFHWPHVARCVLAGFIVTAIWEPTFINVTLALLFGGP